MKTHCLLVAGLLAPTLCLAQPPALLMADANVGPLLHQQRRPVSEWRPAGAESPLSKGRMANDDPAGADDVAAIRTVIDTETRAFHEGRGEVMNAQWALQKPYAERQHTNLIPVVGAPYLKGTSLVTFVANYSKTMQPSGLTVRLTDYDVHVAGPMAWATYTQEELDRAGTVGRRQRVVQILEREPAKGWKIVFLGLQAMH